MLSLTRSVNFSAGSCSERSSTTTSQNSEIWSTNRSSTLHAKPQTAKTKSETPETSPRARPPYFVRSSTCKSLLPDTRSQDNSQPPTGFIQPGASTPRKLVRPARNSKRLPSTHSCVSIRPSPTSGSREVGRSGSGRLYGETGLDPKAMGEDEIIYYSISYVIYYIFYSIYCILCFLLLYIIELRGQGCMPRDKADRIHRR